MKSVGIITMHKVVNYGSALQAWASLVTLRKLGYNAKIIDYIYPNDYHKKKSSIIEKVKQILRFFFHFFQGFPQKRKRKHFEKFWEENYILTDEYKTYEELNMHPPIFDVYLAGSDQIWNYKHTNGDDNFLLNFVHGNSVKLSYASSFASNSIPSYFEEKVKKNLSTFKAISVRESNGCNIIDRFLPNMSKVHLDPTLLISKNEYIDIAKKSVIIIEEPYILVYILQYMFNPYPYATQFVNDVIEQTNLNVVCLDFSSKQKLKGKNIYNLHDSVGPSEFLWLFEHATYVITTSFHGTAFALNFGKSLYSIIRNDGDDRISSILEKVGLHDRIIKLGDKTPKVQLLTNSNAIQERLQYLREEAFNYLKYNIG